MSILRKLDPADKEDYQVLRSMGMMTLQPHWKETKAYLAAELHRLDVRNRTAAPYMNTRLGSYAELLQELLDKFDGALEHLGDGRTG